MKHRMKHSMLRLLAARERSQRRRATADYLRYDGPERRQAPRRRTSELRWRLVQLARRTAA